MVGRRLLPVVANAEIEGEIGKNAPVVLRKDAVAEVVRVGIQTGVLSHACGTAGDEIRQTIGCTGRRVGGVTGTEGKGAVVVQRGKLKVLLKTTFAAKVERVLAASRVERTSRIP